MSVLLTVDLRTEPDVVAARQRGRQLAQVLGFDGQDQTRIATAVSEMARNAYRYAGGGKVEFRLDGGGAELHIKISDRGPGIADLPAVLEGRYQSTTGMGLGIIGTRRLVDRFLIESSRGTGTSVVLVKQLPRPVADVGQITAELARARPADPVLEIQEQNQELLRTLEVLRTQKDELAAVNDELEATNRGVVALYAELDERADYLQRANELKTSFLSNMTHEFRTPVNSIISLARILLDRLDGELSAEQERQVRFIMRSAQDLGDLVNDLLDLAKVEAGKIQVRAGQFEVADMFIALRGMLKPLLASNEAINLVFEEPVGIPTMHTDESKVSQILRNFISNAIKYTEHGEVRVSAQLAAGNLVVFSVADTGIGIADEDQERIFEEFAQVDSPLQRKVRGTGLGLPLARKLAGLLGGSVRLRSQPGVGSTFSALIPAQYAGAEEGSMLPEVGRQLDPARVPVLIVEDNREALFVYDKYLRDAGYQVLPARTVREAEDWLAQARPAAVILDILLEAESTWAFLAELRARPATRDLPILVISMVDNQARARAMGADAYHAKPVDRDWLLAHLTELARGRRRETLLIIDDDEVSRYLLRGLLAHAPYQIVEADGGQRGVELARQLGPAVVFTDLVMPGMSGFGVLESFKADPALSDIPIVVHTAKNLTTEDRVQLAGAVAIIPKDTPSREWAIGAVDSALALAKAKRLDKVVPR
jgi:signal transduction histidine kinase/CheY-like chemotaxis protein